MHISTALLAVLLPALTCAAPLAGGSKIDGEAILLLTCKGEGKPGDSVPLFPVPPFPTTPGGCRMVYMGVCLDNPWGGGWPLKATLSSREESQPPTTLGGCAFVYMGVCLDNPWGGGWPLKATLSSREESQPPIDSSGCYQIYVGVCLGGGSPGNPTIPLVPANGVCPEVFPGICRRDGSPSWPGGIFNPPSYPGASNCTEIMGFCVDTGLPARLLRRLTDRFEDWKKAPSKRQEDAKYNSMASYFPDGVTLSAIGNKGRDTKPKALATVADPSVAWTKEAKTQELAGKMFTYMIKDGAANGAVAGSATMGGARFSCAKDGDRQWNAWGLGGNWEFGCTVDYACTRA